MKEIRWTTAREQMVIGIFFSIMIYFSARWVELVNRHFVSDYQTAYMIAAGIMIAGFGVLVYAITHLNLDILSFLTFAFPGSIPIAVGLGMFGVAGTRFILELIILGVVGLALVWVPFGQAHHRARLAELRREFPWLADRIH